MASTRSKTTEGELKTYCACMEDLKRRLGVIGSITRAQLTLGNEQFDYELISLHFRKALEQLAFASLTAHREMYALVHPGYSRHWNAKRLLESICNVHADFYPIPIEIVRLGSDGIKHLEPRKTGYLTPDQFSTLYDLTSDVLHAPNPFGGGRRINFGVNVDEWVSRFHGLLEMHTIRLAGSTDVWIIRMSDEDGRVRAMGATAIPTIGGGA